MTTPTSTVAVPVKEIGYAQAINYNWWLYEQETTPELVWPQSIAVYDSMRRTDSQVRSVLRAVTYPLRRTPWRIDPNGARDEVVEFVANDLGLPIVGTDPKPARRNRDRFSWDEHLRLALLMLPLGHSYFEQVYRVDPDGLRAHLSKLAQRPARTIEHIDVAPDGGLVSIKQYWTSVNREPRPIPVDRLVAYVLDREGGNWLGESLLRSCYKNWLLKDRLLRVWAQTIERNGMGIPRYTGAEGEPSLTTGLAMAKGWRSGEAAGAAIPYGSKLDLVGVNGTLPEADPAVRYHDEQIARGVLAHFLNLGTQTGSWALGSTFADFFTLSLQTVAQQIADTATCHVVEDLVDVNWGEDEPAPRICFDEIGSRPDAAALSALIQAGAIVSDDTLEAALRQQYGLPPAEPGAGRPTAAGGGTPPAAPADQGYGAQSVVASAADAGPKALAASSDDDEDIDLDDVDDETLALVVALGETGGGPVAAAAGPSFNALHPRGPHGRFRDVVDRIKSALAAHTASGATGDPLAGFTRAQLLKAARLRGFTVKRGAPDAHIKNALIADLTGSHLPVGVTTQPTVFGGMDVHLNGVKIGDIQRTSSGWTAHDINGLAIGNGGAAFPTHDAAVKAVHDRHLNPPAPIQVAPGITLTPIGPMSSHPGAQSFRVEHNGVKVGSIHSGSGKGWTAFPPTGSPYGLQGTPGSGQTSGTQAAAARALVRAHVGANPASTAPVPVLSRVAGTSGVTSIAIPAQMGQWGPAKQSHRIELNGTPIGTIHQWSYGWTAESPNGNPLGTGHTRTAAIQGLVAHHNASLSPAPAATPAVAGPAVPSIGQIKLTQINRGAPGPTAYTVVAGGSHDLGRVTGSAKGWHAYPPAGAAWGLTTSPGGATMSSGPFKSRQSAVSALSDSYRWHLASLAPPPSAPPAPRPAGRVGGPEISAALDVVYGVDPKAGTAARQMKVYGDLRRSHFDTLDPAEQSVILGDLSHIAATSKGSNSAAAQKLFDRFTPPGTPSGTTPGQPVIPPAGAVSSQMRVHDPLGTPGLLKMPKSGQGGKKGDGWTRTASGGSGPWGHYGAGGLMLRHVDDNGVERFLMIERGPAISDPGKWQFPGGAKDEKETFYEGAVRETVEELGFKSTDLDSARVHGTHTSEASGVMVPGLHGGQVPWAYVSIAATVPHQIKPDLSTHHARAETSDAKWMTRQEIADLDRQGKLLKPLAGGKIDQNVMTLFPATTASKARGGRPARLTGPVPALHTTVHKPSRGRDLVGDQAAQDKLRADVAALRAAYKGKTADERLAAIGHLQGYDDTPTVVTKAEMDRLLATGDYIEAWRGVSGAGFGSGWSRGPRSSKTAAQIAEEMRSGPAYYGTGIFGNGYYIATDKAVARGYSDGSKNSLIRILIPKAAKTDKQANVERKAAATSSSVSHVHTGSRSTGGGTLRNPGRYAAAAGLDGVEIPHNTYGAAGGAGHIARPGQPAYNWLNRSVLIIQEAE